MNLKNNIKLFQIQTNLIQQVIHLHNYKYLLVKMKD